MSTTSLADDIEQHMKNFGGSQEDAAKIVCARRDREAELAQTRDPAVLCDEIGERLGLQSRLKIERVVKTKEDPPHYRIETDGGGGDGGGRVPLGPSGRWATRPGDFATAFLDHCQEMPRVPRGDKWRELCSMIARAAVEEDIGAEATDEGWAFSRLRDYLAARPPVATLDEAVATEYPWTDEHGVVWIFGPPFSRWTFLSYRDALTPQQLGKRLRSIGCEPKSENVVVEGKRTTRSVWKLPTLDAPTDAHGEDTPT
jgi:hypothetical protein